MVGQVTLDDVARVSGVSVAAASRALNGRDGVRPDVRERVSRVADSLGYRPNRAARNLASGRSSVIGLVLPTEELRTDPYGVSIVHSVARAATEADQGLMLILATSEPGSQVGHILRDGIIDGVIVSAVAVGEAWVEELLDAEIPTVLVGTHPRRSDVPTVETENRRSSAEAVEHLFDQGCTRVGIITGPLDRADALARLDGYRDAHAARGIPVDERLMARGDFTRSSGRLAATRILEHRPDAIFAGNDEMAAGALSVLEAGNIDVPNEVALVGFDGTAMVDQLHVSLTTVRQPFAELGRAAVAELMKLLDGETVEPLRLIDPVLSIGQSSLREQPNPEVRRPS